MGAEALAILAFLVMGYGLISGRVEGSPITPPMFFVCVLLSVFLHGLSANPGARWYASRISDGAGESQPDSEMLLRLGGPGE